MGYPIALSTEFVVRAGSGSVAGSQVLGRHSTEFDKRYIPFLHFIKMCNYRHYSRKNDIF